jgi:hypothetical protein
VERIAELESSAKEKQMRIAALLEENKTLVSVQRTQAKQIEEQENSHEHYPAKVLLSQELWIRSRVLLDTIFHVRSANACVLMLISSRMHFSVLCCSFLKDRFYHG